MGKYYGQDGTSSWCVSKSPDSPDELTSLTK